MQKKESMKRTINRDWVYKRPWLTYCFCTDAVIFALMLRPQPFYLRACGVVLVHCAQMVWLPKYRKHMQTITRHGVMRGISRVNTCFNAMFDSRLGALPMALFSLIPSPLSNSVRLCVALFGFYHTGNIPNEIRIAHELCNQRVYPLFDLQDWFLSHPTYDPSIDDVLQPIIRELYSVSSYLPLEGSDKDMLPPILQLASDWVFVEQVKCVKNMVENTFPLDIANLILQYANIPVGDNDKRRKKLMHKLAIYHEQDIL